MAKTMDRVALLIEPCLLEVFYEKAPATTVTEVPIALAVKDELLVLVPSPQPEFDGEQSIIAQIDHPPHAVLLSLVQMNLSLPLISRSFNLSPKASPIRIPVRKRRRNRARSRMSSITQRSFLTSAGFMARGRTSGSFSLMPRLRRDPGMTSCSIRKCRKAIMQASLVRTVEIRNPRSCSCSMKAFQVNPLHLSEALSCPTFHKSQGRAQLT